MNDDLANETGAILKKNGRCTFRVWAPKSKTASVNINEDRYVKMNKDAYGYFTAVVENVAAGSSYRFRIDTGEFPDPASHYQPAGVHGPSEVVDHGHYQWHDDHWKGLEFGNLILYEIHVGTFTAQGTFEAIIPRLDELAAMGINAIELMPVGQFPGSRNWGYDGVYPYAVQNSYGGPQGLKRLVDACHQKSIAVFLDVIYNHLGPEGNYFAQFGPYFSDRYSMPWGDALNFDGEWSDGVKDYFSNNVIYWFDTFHIDGLRLDAIHTIHDESAINFWEITENKVRALEKQCGRKLHMVAESDFNSPKVVKPSQQGGYGFDAQWLDDFHHALYTVLDKKGRTRYEDYGSMDQLAKAYRDGFVLSGDWVKFRKRKFGASSAGVPGNRFVVFNQNHDQVGNRVGGERLSVLVDFERLKIAAAAVLLSPYVPMLFMGEEFGEDNPFYFFVSHSEEKLIKAVREGRKKDFSGFEDEGEFPDPQDEKTFRASQVDWEKRNEGKHRVLLDWHKSLINLRRTYPALSNPSKDDLTVKVIGEQGLRIVRGNIHCLFNFSEQPLPDGLADDRYELLLHSKDGRWMDQERPAAKASASVLAPLSVSVYHRLQ